MKSVHQNNTILRNGQGQKQDCQHSNIRHQ